MYQTLLSICLISIFVFNAGTLAATADDLFSDIPREYLERLIGNVDGLTFDIEKQEVVEIPSIKFKIQVRPGGSSNPGRSTTTTSPSSPSSTTSSSISSTKIQLPSSTSKIPETKSSTTPISTTTTPSLIRNGKN